MGSKMLARTYGWALRGTAVLVATMGLGLAGGSAPAGASNDPGVFCSNLTFSVPRYVTPVNNPTDAQLRSESESVKATGAALVAVGAQSPNAGAATYLKNAGADLLGVSTDYTNAIGKSGKARTKLLNMALVSFNQFAVNMGKALPIEQSVCHDFGVAGRAAVTVAGKAASSARAAKRVVSAADMRLAVAAGAHSKVRVASWSEMSAPAGVALKVRMKLVVNGVTYNHCAVFASKVGAEAQMVSCLH
jgi:hypothetical protein